MTRADHLALAAHYRDRYVRQGDPRDLVEATRHEAMGRADG